MPQVLLIEDNAMNRKLMRDILEMRFDVVASGRARDAVKLEQLLRVGRNNLVFGVRRNNLNRRPVIAGEKQALAEEADAKPDGLSRHEVLGRQGSSYFQVAKEAVWIVATHVTCHGICRATHDSASIERRSDHTAT